MGKIAMIESSGLVVHVGFPSSLRRSHRFWRSSNEMDCLGDIPSCVKCRNRNSMVLRVIQQSIRVPWAIVESL
jgi:hypothetical protein